MASANAFRLMDFDLRHSLEKLRSDDLLSKRVRSIRTEKPTFWNVHRFPSFACSKCRRHRRIATCFCHAFDPSVRRWCPECGETRAGFPVTVENGGMLVFRTQAAPTIEPSPISAPGKSMARAPIQTLLPIEIPQRRSRGFKCAAASAGAAAKWSAIVTSCAINV